MVKVTTSNGSPHLASLVLADDKTTAIIVVESNEKDQVVPGQLQSFLADFWTGGRKIPLGDSWPVGIAASLHQFIPSWRGGELFALFYAGVFLGTRSVAVCTAGEIRVHLSESGRLIESTRDHNALSDDWPGKESLNPILRKGLPTRSLGPPNSKAPEETLWQTRTPFEVTICSAGAHRYEQPESYISECSRDDYQVCGKNQGLVIRAEVKS